MYNKLILKNAGDPFAVTFDGKEHKIPTGTFEAEENLGNFIFRQANKWNMKVTRLSQPETPQVKAIVEHVVEITEAEVEEKLKEEAKEEVKEEKKDRKVNFKL